MHFPFIVNNFRWVSLYGRQDQRGQGIYGRIGEEMKLPKLDGSHDLSRDLDEYMLPSWFVELKTIVKWKRDGTRYHSCGGNCCQSCQWLNLLLCLARFVFTTLFDNIQFICNNFHDGYKTDLWSWSFVVQTSDKQPSVNYYLIFNLKVCDCLHP